MSRLLLMFERLQLAGAARMSPRGCRRRCSDSVRLVVVDLPDIVDLQLTDLHGGTMRGGGTRESRRSLLAGGPGSRGSQAYGLPGVVTVGEAEGWVGNEPSLDVNILFIRTNLFIKYI
uniref:Uncharacterized protein n=1 Tax=Sphaerodactylus townsendi TaxID=933632 RepID=A0ACB8FWN1_9SAUR